MKNNHVHAGDRSKDEWLTPPEIITALGPFDLDPCSPVDRPWPTAANHFTIHDNGLMREWFGRVWMNPPYSYVEPWLNKLCLHSDGYALIFSKTETIAVHQFVWPFADSEGSPDSSTTFYQNKPRTLCQPKKHLNNIGQI